MSRGTTKGEAVLDEVRALRPTGDDTWARSDAGRAVMARAMATAPATQDQAPGRRSRRVLVAGGLAAALTVAGGTAAAVVIFRADSPTQAGCYSTLSASADTTEASADLVADVGAAEACRRTWAGVGEDVDTRNLVACVNEYGGRGVFPAPIDEDAASACARIGWQPDAG